MANRNFIVTVNAKQKHRDWLRSFVEVVEAPSAAEALRKAASAAPEVFGDQRSVNYNVPRARLLRTGDIYEL